MPSSAQLLLTVESRDDSASHDVEIATLIIAGWTGRNQEAMEAHIRELEAIGISRPTTTPIFYRVAASLLTTADEIQVSGAATSGEVEAVMFQTGGERWVGLGSDHTDREAETVNISLAKQACAKVIAPTIWRYDDVADHWDDLVLRAFAHEGGQRVLYQEGPITTMRHPDDLAERYGGQPENSAMFCGTLAVAGDIRPADAFEMELEDPVLNRLITHTYRIVPLPVEG